jgi:hypothetical protein
MPLHKQASKNLERAHRKAHTKRICIPAARAKRDFVTTPG